MAQDGFLTEGGGLLRILYLGTRNSLSGVSDLGFTKSNTTGNAQLEANTTVADVIKVGCLAGSVAALAGEDVVGPGTGPTDAVVGLFVNDLAGNAYESTSAAASEKGVYVCNMGTYETLIYETHDTAGLGGASILGNYSYGKPLYCSQNGLLTVEEGLAGGSAPAGSVVIGIVTKAPTASDPVLRFNLRI